MNVKIKKGPSPHGPTRAAVAGRAEPRRARPRCFVTRGLTAHCLVRRCAAGETEAARACSWDAVIPAYVVEQLGHANIEPTGEPLPVTAKEGPRHTDRLEGRDDVVAEEHRNDSSACRDHLSEPSTLGP